MVDDIEAQRHREERAAAGRLAKADRDVVTGLLSTPMGRHWYERLLEFCGLYDYDFRGSKRLHIGLGRKQVGGYLLNQVEMHAPEAYLRMLTERRARIELETVKKAEDDKTFRRSDRPLDLFDMPDETPYESMMDSQARELAPKEPK